MTHNLTEQKALLTAVVDHVLPVFNGAGGVIAGVPGYLEQLLESTHGSGYKTLMEWGLQCIEDEFHHRHGKAFSIGETEQCIEVLKALEKLEHNHYQAFWHTLIRLCLEGFLTHPRHGGNRDAVSWRMLGYPGCVDNAVSLSISKVV